MELNRIINADCMDVLKTIPDKYFNLAIIDPPYGIKEDGKKNHSRGCKAVARKYTPKEWDRSSAPPEYFKELFRVSKNQIIFGANHFISKIPINSSCWVVWDKQNGKSDFADCELAWISFKTAVRKFEFRWQGMLQGDMRNKELRIHPTQKPVALYKMILQKYAKQGDLILDTHAGSCSSVIACIELGFKYLAIEKDSEYFNNAIDRINKELNGS